MVERFRTIVLPLSLTDLRVRGLALLTLVGALGIAVWGQSRFVAERGFTWDAVAAYVVAVALFGLVCRVVGVPAQPVGTAVVAATAPRLNARWRIGLRAGALAVSFVAGSLAFSPEPPTILLLALWAGALAAYQATWVRPWPSLPSRTTLSLCWRRHRVEIGAFALLLVAALLLRAVALDTVPQNMGGDEGSQGLEALRVLSGEVKNPFGTGWLGVPNGSFFFQALFLRLLGADFVGLRLPWALVGTATVATMSGLVRHLHGRRLAWVVAVLLAAYPYHIHYSRLGSNQIADPLFMSLTLLCWLWGVARRRLWAVSLAGLVAGVSLYGYAGARLVPLLALAMFAFLLIRRGPDRPGWQEGLALVGGIVVAALPILLYAHAFPDEFNSRVNAVGILQSGWLEREVVIRGEPAWQILLDQFRRAALAFNAYPDRTVWFNPPDPLLDFVSGILFTFGLAELTRRGLERRYFALAAWFWAALILGGVLTESPPSSQRLITLAPVALFAVGLALTRTADLLTQIVGVVRVRAYFVPVCVVLISLWGIQYYFQDYTGARRYNMGNGERATELALYLRHWGSHAEVWLFGAPRLYMGFGTIAFLAPDVPSHDLPEAPTPVPEITPADRDLVFVFLPERIKEMDAVKARYPGGVAWAVYRTQKPDEALFTIYRVSRESLP